MAERIRAVVVTMFGDDAEPDRGETAAFRAAWELTHVEAGAIPVYRREDGVLLLSTGVGPANAAAAVMQIGLDPRFDLSGAAWIVAGIAGIDPEAGGLGEVCLCDFCVDGDLAFEFTGPDVPADWSTGILPLGGRKPFDADARKGQLFEGSGQVFSLRGERFDRALDALGEKVRIGTVLSAGRFWHGHDSLRWARDWVHYWTEGASRFVVSAMEDTGLLTALYRLSTIGRTRLSEAVVLRAASNFAAPVEAISAVASLTAAQDAFDAPGMAPALRNLVAAVEKVLGTLD